VIKKSVFNSLVSVGTYQDFISAILSLAESKVPSYVCFMNVHMLVEAEKNLAFRKIVNEADIVAPDGRPISIFLRWFKGIKQERVCGMDILPDLLQWSEALNKSVYFYGTTDVLLSAMIRKAKNEFPTLKIAGHYSPPFKASLSHDERADTIQRIRLASPDMVFVALGCPKQEKWMADMKNELNTCMLGLGQAFHVYADTERRLPRWMRNLSLEWIFRLCQDPARLWKRYAYTNSYFLFMIAKYLMDLGIQKIYSLLFKSKSFTSRIHRKRRDLKKRFSLPPTTKG
jgi:N-acetylglucosaminyldiphosphoundecaprenol N-acetyl-beta-D-mannosaminyltransferase